MSSTAPSLSPSQEWTIALLIDAQPGENEHTLVFAFDVNKGKVSGNVKILTSDNQLMPLSAVKGYSRELTEVGSQDPARPATLLNLNFTWGARSIVLSGNTFPVGPINKFSGRFFVFNGPIEAQDGGGGIPAAPGEGVTGTGIGKKETFMSSTPPNPAQEWTIDMLIDAQPEANEHRLVFALDINEGNVSGNVKIRTEDNEVIPLSAVNGYSQVLTEVSSADPARPATLLNLNFNWGTKKVVLSGNTFPVGPINKFSGRFFTFKAIEPENGNADGGGGLPEAPGDGDTGTGTGTQT